VALSFHGSGELVPSDLAVTCFRLPTLWVESSSHHFDSVCSTLLMLRCYSCCWPGSQSALDRAWISAYCLRAVLATVSAGGMAALFAARRMAKPMVITSPFVLFLLDYRTAGQNAA